MRIKVKSLSGRIPEYQTDGAAGMDISAYLEEPIVLKPMERRLVPTGLFVEIPEGYEAQIRARSGLAIKHGIGLVNGVGTVDSDYRGHWHVPVINWGTEDFVINDGDRIAQAVFSKVEKAEIELVDEVNETERGEGGFGHTGV